MRACFHVFLGLAYGFIIYRTCSSKWMAISLSLTGALALAAPLVQITRAIVS
jgi:hypothetical protein